MLSDETDAALLALLAENARMPVATMARRLGLARTTVQARLDKLENNGTIAGYTLRLGASLRPRVRATVLLSAEPRASAAILSRLKSLPQVEAVHNASGRFDMIVQVAADTTEELDDLLDKIGDAQGVKSSESLIHLSTKIDRRL
ncbi:transcriptional regulator, AsnC family [Thalassovita litoralis]|uniref:Transcriptional regulator, AsnC family n=1 Tax=Thalassovita litoralis TaxID=1010611 RepID=A0A521F9E7_9RHOB|nr:Lrp/AsnC family transcriptional regulator [Thalassovita litoralis]SMO92788.1 transcriptional regulator, AsnC family [Thalassovita litoralis]